LAYGTAPNDAAAYGQLTSVDGNVVHLTGNETITGTKTFNSSPVIPVQPTLLTQAASQKMVASLRPVSWSHPITVIVPSPTTYLLYTIESICYSPFEIGCVPLQTRNMGSGSTLNELRITSSVMHAGLPLVGMIVRASNFRSPVSSVMQSPNVQVGIWDASTGALLASSPLRDLRYTNLLPSGVLQYDNFWIPFSAIWTPTVTKRYVYGVWWSHITNRINNNSIYMSTTVNNSDVFQITPGSTYDGVLVSCAYKTGVSAFPTTLSLSGWTIDTNGMDCTFIVHNPSIW
jgi:hypothetical protein